MPPIVPLALGAAGFLTKYLNKPKDLDYDFNYDTQQAEASTFDYAPANNYLQNANLLRTQGANFLTGQSDMQKSLLSEAYKTSFGLGDQQFNQANTAIAQQGVGGGGLSRAFRAITRSSAGEDYRKSALGIGTSFAGLGLNALQSSLGAYGQMDTTRANVGMYNVGQQNQVGMFNAAQETEANRYGNNMGYEQMIGNANAGSAWGDSLGNSLFDMAGMTMPEASWTGGNIGGASTATRQLGGASSATRQSWTPQMNQSFGPNAGAYQNSFGMNMNPNRARQARDYYYSDNRLKTDIKSISQSPSGINIYSFKYKGDDKTYQGVMAQEVPWASFRHENGYLAVDYNKVDVDFERIDY